MGASTVISLRLKNQQRSRLERLARRLGRKPGEIAAQLLDEGLRMSEYPYIEFRDSMVGRQAYISGSSLAVWEVAMSARPFAGGERVAETARYLQWPAIRVQAALRYAEDFPEEIDAALADNDSYDFARLSRELPGITTFTIPRDDRNVAC
jgi:uncharacterized protein (DUF433 family)